MRKNESYKYTSIILTSLIFVLLEFLFRVFNGFNLLAYHAYFFNIFFGILVGFLTRLFSEKVNRVLNLIIVGIVVVFYCMQLCMYQMYGFYFQVSLSSAADQVLGFFGEAVKLIVSKLFYIIIFFIPFVLAVVFTKKIWFKRLELKGFGKVGLCLLISACLFFGTLYINKNEEASAYQLQYERINISASIEKLGVLDTIIIDLFRTITDFTEEITIEEPPVEEPVIDDTPKEYGYNVLDIDFDSLIASETNNDVITMHQYFQNQTGTKQNEYTGLFAGKNLILIMAESFNEVAVSEEYTPTLYKMIHEGFNFTEFYTPENYSTIGGEFQELTGLLMAYKVACWRSGENYFPMGVGNIFKNLGYKTYAYHNSTYTFQDRNKYLASIGLENYLGCKNGLEERMSCKLWPASDDEMIQSTYYDWINDEHFMTYYATVSGHFDYSFSKSDNNIAYMHKDEMYALGLDVSEGTLAYLATQMELDRAMATLLELLEENGRAEDTVIALVGDHYPYALSVNQVNELSDYERDEVIDINHSNFILYNPGQTPVTVDKVGYQCDVIPTLYNLFGLEYDSRLFTGRDILSETPGLAIFADNSWVSDYGKYYYKTKTFVPTTDEELPENYVSKTMNDVYNRLNMAKLIMKYDYYAKVFEKGE